VPISDLVRRSILLASSFNGGGAPSRLYSSKQLCCSSLSPCSLIIATGHAGAQETLRVALRSAGTSGLWRVNSVFLQVSPVGPVSGLNSHSRGQASWINAQACSCDGPSDKMAPALPAKSSGENGRAAVGAGHEQALP
jgi:hypothetical protein